MKLEKLTETQIQNTVRSAVQNAVSFIESEVAQDRITAQKYFEGKTSLEHEEGRSKVVATKCRDTIRAIKPSLMRVFLQSDKPVEFVPRRPEAVQGAEQASKFAAFTFQRNNGFRVLSDVFHDALVKKVGIAKVFYDETDRVEVDEYSGLTQEQVDFILAQDDVEVIEQTIEQEAEIDEMGVDISPAYMSLRVAKTFKEGEIKVLSIAPEDFFIDESSTSIDDFYVCGHSTEGRVGDLVALGFDFEEVHALAGASSNGEEEDFERRGYDDDQKENADDPSMHKILITEAYMKMDIDGMGVARMYKFICAGDKYEILDYELCDYVPFAVFEVDPEPHTFFGRSMVDIIINDQDAATSMLRGLLDNVAMMNNPAIYANVNALQDPNELTNNEIGRIVRTNGDPRAAVVEGVVGTAANALLPAIQHYDETVRAKTGVTGASMGMDADALQGQTATGVNAAVQAATAVSELIARTLAEGGMKQMFKLIAQIARQHPQENQMMRIDGKFVPVDPTSWGTDIDLMTNVGLGNNRREEKIMALMAMQQRQAQVYAQMGPMNGLVTMTNMRAAEADILALQGIHNADKYWQQMDAQTEMQLLQAQMGQQQGQQPDPNAGYVQGEQIKAQADLMKNQQNVQVKMVELAAKDDRERDKMAQDLAIEAAKIGGMDTQAVRREQEMPRQLMGMPNGQ